jgi:sulfate/thiosulfate transport system ATP-binding protein
MGFLGPVTTLGGQLVRPHDIEVLLEPSNDATAATVTRLTGSGTRCGPSWPPTTAGPG